MRWDDFLALPEVRSQLPVRFRNGNLWEHFEGHCADCDRPITQDMLRGRIDTFEDYRGTNETRFLRAWGFCKRCSRLTSYSYYLHPDLSLEGLSNKGNWAVWTKDSARQKPSWWKRLKRLFAVKTIGT